MADETATLAAYVANLTYDAIPREVLERAKSLTLDFLGSAVRARRYSAVSPGMRTLQFAASSAAGVSVLLLSSIANPPCLAAGLSAGSIRLRSLFGDDHPADAEFVGDHAEAFGEECLGQRHLHLAAIAEPGEHFFRLVLALGAECQRDALEFRFAGCIGGTLAQADTGEALGLLGLLKNAVTQFEPATPERRLGHEAVAEDGVARVLDERQRQPLARNDAGENAAEARMHDFALVDLVVQGLRG